MTAALEWGEWSAARPYRTLPPGKTRCPFYRRLGGPYRDSIPDRPARSQSLYRLSYPAHTHTRTRARVCVCGIKFLHHFRKVTCPVASLICAPAVVFIQIINFLLLCFTFMLSSVHSIIIRTPHTAFLPVQNK